MSCSNEKEKSSNWIKTIGSNYFDECYDIAVDEDGNTYFTGVFSNELTEQHLKSNGALDIVVGKLNEYGDIEWIKNFGGKNEDEAYSIIISNCNVYVAGYFSDEIRVCGKKYVSVGVEDAFLLKLSKDGDELSFQAFGSKGHDEAVTLQLTDNKEILVGGFFEMQLIEFPQLKSNGEIDAFIAKMDEYNKITAIKNYGGVGNDRVSCNKKDINGNFFFAGSMYVDSVQKEDNWILTIDEELTLKTSFTFGSKAYDQIHSIDVFKNNIIISGEYKNGLWRIADKQLETPYYNYSDAYFASISKNQKLNWIKTISSPKHEWAKGLCVTEENIYMASEFNDSAFVSFESDKFVHSKGLYDVYLAKIDDKGEVLANILIQGKSEEGINKLVINGKHLYACGWVYDTVYFNNQKAISKGEGDVYVWKCELDKLFKKN